MLSPDFSRPQNFQSRFLGYTEFSQHGFTVSENMTKFATSTDKDYRKYEQNTPSDTELFGL